MSLPPADAAGLDVAGVPNAPTTTGDKEQDQQPEAPNFTLSIVSPSTGVSSPLSFPRLPVTTTVKQLKAKIRDVVSSRPPDNGQRLIHRGRLLGSEAETMLEIFGQEILQNPEPQTLHLVLRPLGPDPPTTNPSTSPAAAPQQVNTLTPPLPANPFRRITTPNTINTLPGPPVTQPFQPQPLNLDFSQHTVAQRLGALQREAARIQQQMGSLEQRAQMIAAGHPDILPPPPPQLPLPSFDRLIQPQASLGGRNSPQPLRATQQPAAGGQYRAQDQQGGANRTGLPQPVPGGAGPNIYGPEQITSYVREQIGPNGERWNVTINGSSSSFAIPRPAYPYPAAGTYQHHGVPPAPDGLQDIGRDPNRFLPSQSAQNTQTLQNNIGSATNTSPWAGLPPHTQHTASVPPHSATPNPATSFQPPLSPSNSGPGISTPPNPRAGSPFWTDPRAQHTTSQSPTWSSNSGQLLSIPPLNANPSASNAVTPVVYLLYSPNGLRAVLVNNSAAFYTTPEIPRPRHRHNDSPVPAADQVRGQGAAPTGVPEVRDGAAQRRPRHGNHNHQGNDPLEPVAAPHANPQGGALGARVGPLIWLVIRLVGFIWILTSGNNSWLRFLTLSTIAIVVFLANAGVLNGITEQLWGPIRRHVEALIPLAGPEAALIPAANAVPVPRPADPTPPANPRGARRRHGELDEAEVAARILEQRRQANGGWLMAQIRAAEHAALLFLASLVPGVGERHIAAREAEANAAEAERQRQIEAAAASTSSDDSGSQPEGGASGDSGHAHGRTEGANGHPAQPAVEA